MAAPKRSHHQIAKDRQQISRLYLEGLTQYEIAERMGVSQPQISYDLAAIRRAWVEATTLDLDAHKAIELQRINSVMNEFLAAWKLSIANGRDGNPRLLFGVIECVRLRCKLLGLIESRGK